MTDLEPPVCATCGEVLCIEEHEFHKKNWDRWSVSCRCKTRWNGDRGALMMTIRVWNSTSAADPDKT